MATSTSESEFVPSPELLRQVRRLESRARRLVADRFLGQYHSVFRGRGLEFSEVREYQPGDDVRTIDWNVTARMGTPYVKRFVEERELTVLLAVDGSASQRFGTAGGGKDQGGGGRGGGGAGLPRRRRSARTPALRPRGGQRAGGAPPDTRFARGGRGG